MPWRSDVDTTLAQYALSKNDNVSYTNQLSSHETYRQLLALQLFGRPLFTRSVPLGPRTPKGRVVPTSAYKILDASDLIDDYYLNVLDWHPKHNILAIALGSVVYIWYGDTGDVSKVRVFFFYLSVSPFANIVST